MDAVNYKNGQKNQWRRTAWNAIAKNLKVPAKDAIVLYLPGATDLDRAEAVRRGFKPANLIAVERDAKVAAHLRSMGTTTIVGTLNDVLLSWPASVPLAVVVADFQCGINEDVERFAGYCASHPALTQATVLVNLQRGRDPQARRLTTGAWLGALPDVLGNGAFADRNRAGLFTELLITRIAGELAEACERAKVRSAEIVAKCALLKASGNFEEMGQFVKQLPALREECDQLGRPINVAPLPSYRSTPLSPVFDGAIYSWFGLLDHRKRLWSAVQSLDDAAKLKGQVRACLAIRTRRLRGELAA